MSWENVIEFVHQKAKASRGAEFHAVLSTLSCSLFSSVRFSWVESRLESRWVLLFHGLSAFQVIFVMEWLLNIWRAVLQLGNFCPGCNATHTHTHKSTHTHIHRVTLWSICEILKSAWISWEGKLPGKGASWREVPHREGTAEGTGAGTGTFLDPSASIGALKFSWTLLFLLASQVSCFSF